MNLWVQRVLGRVVSLREDETKVALLMFAYSFLAMTAHNILKPVTGSNFIDQLGADNQPFVQLAVGLFIGVLMHWYSNVVRKLPRRRVIPITQLAIVAILVAFWGLQRTGAVWVTVGLYSLGLLLGVFLISQFWTLANEIYDARQAKRLFGFIGGGASLGGAVGATTPARAGLPGRQQQHAAHQRRSPRPVRVHRQCDPSPAADACQRRLRGARRRRT
jgi:AAA family ATP:ADP antiporter